jgi:drug/metabolite transporter (DMT)-like permease
MKLEKVYNHGLIALGAILTLSFTFALFIFAIFLWMEGVQDVRVKGGVVIFDVIMIITSGSCAYTCFNRAIKRVKSDGTTSNLWTN